MIFIVALLIAVGILAAPIRADIKKHGHDNIIVLAVQDIVSFSPIAALVALVSEALNLARGIFMAFLFAVAVFAVFAVLWMLFW